MKTGIGVDIGGTKIEFVVINEQGEILSTYRLPTAPEEGEKAVLDRIVQGIHHMRQEYQPAGIGIGCPGYVDSEAGVVRQAVNLYWDEVYLVNEVRRRLADPLPVYIQNDVNAAILGEFHFGAAKDCKDVVYLAIGTGLGAAAIVNGTIVNGANGFAMEVGHLVLQHHGRSCRCGLRGCAEMYVSGLGLQAGIREYQEIYPQSSLKGEVSTSDILSAAKKGDPLAEAVLQEAARYLGQVFAICANFYNPSLIILGGGMGLAAAEFLIDPAVQEMQGYTPPGSYENMKIVKSQIESVAVGAATLALR